MSCTTSVQALTAKAPHGVSSNSNRRQHPARPCCNLPQQWVIHVKSNRQIKSTFMMPYCCLQASCTTCVYALIPEPSYDVSSALQGRRQTIAAAYNVRL
eukprot:1093789-Pelagomonas_calceolata.AAC.2